MKNMITMMIGIVIGAITILIILTVTGRMNYATELESQLPAYSQVSRQKDIPWWMRLATSSADMKNLRRSFRDLVQPSRWWILRKKHRSSA